MKQIWSLFFLCIALVSICGQSVRASVESSEVYLGQPFEFRIIIEGTTAAEAPDLNELEGFKIQYKGASTSMVSSFGGGSNSSSKTITYSWSFTPLRKGSLLIPSFSIEVDGKIFNTASGSILVKDPEQIDGFQLFLETEKNVYWQGEPIDLKINWLFSSSVSNPVFNLPFINSGLFKIKNQVPPAGNDVYKLNINGLEVLAMQSAQIYKGDQYSSLSFNLKLMPEETGNFDIGPVTLAFDSAERSNGFRTSYKSSVIPSNSLTLDIKELPPDAYEKGTPVILSKGVLRVETKAEPDRVHIGDPLTYTIRVIGAVTPDNAEIPDLNSYSQMAENFSIPEGRPPIKTDGETVIYTQTIRVKNSQISSIPELPLKYFDIESGKVGLVMIPSIPLDVLETDVVTSANLESTGYTVRDKENHDELVTNDEGLLYNYDSKLLLKNKNRNKMDIITNPLYWILLLLAPSIYLTLVIYKHRIKIYKILTFFRKDNTDFTKIYNELISSNDFDITTIKNEIRKYITLYCSDSEGFLTADEIYKNMMHKGNDKEISSAVHELFLSFEEYEYSKEKISPLGKNVLIKFYSLSREFK